MSPAPAAELPRARRHQRGMRAKRRPKKTLAFLIDPAQLVRLARIAEALKARHPGTQITRADAARAAVHVGIEKLEREMGISA